MMSNTSLTPSTPLRLTVGLSPDLTQHDFEHFRECISALLPTDSAQAPLTVAEAARHFVEVSSPAFIDTFVNLALQQNSSDLCKSLRLKYGPGVESVVGLGDDVDEGTSVAADGIEEAVLYVGLIDKQGRHLRPMDHIVYLVSVDEKVQITAYQYGWPSQSARKIRRIQRVDTVESTSSSFTPNVKSSLKVEEHLPKIESNSKITRKKELFDSENVKVAGKMSTSDISKSTLQVLHQQSKGKHQQEKLQTKVQIRKNEGIYRNNNESNKSKRYKMSSPLNDIQNNKNIGRERLLMNSLSGISKGKNEINEKSLLLSKTETYDCLNSALFKSIKVEKENVDRIFSKSCMMSSHGQTPSLLWLQDSCRARGLATGSRDEMLKKLESFEDIFSLMNNLSTNDSFLENTNHQQKHLSNRKMLDSNKVKSASDQTKPTKSELIKMCEAKGLQTHGTKAELRSRILADIDTDDENSDNDSDSITMNAALSVASRFSKNSTTSKIKSEEIQNDERKNHRTRKAVTKEAKRKAKLSSKHTSNSSSGGLLAGIFGVSP